MNQGLYGMASGGGASGGRKISGVVSSGVPIVATSPAVAWSYFGYDAPRITTSAGVRTRVASVSGRGALRHFATQISIPANDISRVEVVIDGKRIVDISVSLAQAGSQGINAVGWAYNVSGNALIAIPDYIPFDSSCELFVTNTTGGTLSTFVTYRIDLHE